MNKPKFLDHVDLEEFMRASREVIDAIDEEYLDVDRPWDNTKEISPIPFEEDDPDAPVH